MDIKQYIEEYNKKNSSTHETKYIDDIKESKKWEAQDLNQDQFPDKDQWAA